MLLCSVIQGVAEIAGQSGLYDYDMIEITNPNLLLIKGAREGVLLETCRDLSYLHLLYVINRLIYLFIVIYAVVDYNTCARTHNFR